ncbi:MAG: C1 family peptidase [Pirellulaceae bacterium]|nr:C1 family peptidase [Pirellulaceae bacterium]
MKNQMMNTSCVRFRSLAPLIGSILVMASPVFGSEQDTLRHLREQAAQEGWTFNVGANPATEIPLVNLTGVVVPENWRVGANFDDIAVPASSGLPSAWDWRTEQGSGTVPPIRNQGQCGSCWAFAVMGSLESGVGIRDGSAPDLSEQWLVSCCGLGGCSGEWSGNAANYLLANGPLDQCGLRGAPWEADFPYQGADVPCTCPEDRPYTIESWAFIGPQWGTPSEAQLKQAILDYGPITVCVYADSAFQYYTGDVFNACTSSDVNHAVVLVGWDDAQGSDGVWILRNSWGSWWGEGGYMRIEYGCSRIGYGGLYLNVGNIGACCFGEYCVSSPEETCQNAGGTFLGVGVSCEASSCVVPCVGDITGDGLVDTSDLLELISAWDCADCQAEDVDGDGIVTAGDLLQLLAAWGACP